MPREVASLSTEGLLAVVVLRVGGRHNNEANFNWRSPEQKAQVSQKMHQILTYLVNAEDVDGT